MAGRVEIPPAPWEEATIPPPPWEAGANSLEPGNQDKISDIPPAPWEASAVIPPAPWEQKPAENESILDKLKSVGKYVWEEAGKPPLNLEGNLPEQLPIADYPVSGRIQAVGRGTLDLFNKAFTPINMALIAGSAGLAEIHPLVGRAISALFGTQMAQGAIESFKAYKKALDSGNEAEALKIGTEIAGLGAMAAGGLAHGFGKEGPIPIRTRPPTEEEMAIETNLKLQKPPIGPERQLEAPKAPGTQGSVISVPPGEPIPPSRRLEGPRAIDPETTRLLERLMGKPIDQIRREFVKAELEKAGNKMIEPPAPIERLKSEKKVADFDPIKDIYQKGGLDPADPDNAELRNMDIPFGVYRKGGKSLDTIREAWAEEGRISQDASLNDVRNIIADNLAVKKGGGPAPERTLTGMLDQEELDRKISQEAGRVENMSEADLEKEQGKWTSLLASEGNLYAKERTRLSEVTDELNARRVRGREQKIQEGHVPRDKDFEEFSRFIDEAARGSGQGEEMSLPETEFVKAARDKGVPDHLIMQEVYTDELTGAWNRKYAKQKGYLEEKDGRPNILFDVDHFKKVNDTYGHTTGDTVLTAIGNLAKKHGFEITRLGGEEFQVYPKPGENPVEFAKRFLEFQKELAGYKVTDGDGNLLFEGAKVSAGFGRNMKMADDFAYKAKRDGRDRLILDKSEFDAYNEKEKTNHEWPGQASSYTYKRTAETPAPRQGETSDQGSLERRGTDRGLGPSQEQKNDPLNPEGKPWPSDAGAVLNPIEFGSRIAQAVKQSNTLQEFKDIVKSDKDLSDTVRFMSVNLQEVYDRNKKPFYSGLQRTINEKMPAAAPVDQVRAILKNESPEEVQWSGVDEFLQGKAKVSKQELMDFLKQNEVQVKEVMKGKKLPTDERNFATYAKEEAGYSLNQIERAWNSGGEDPIYKKWHQLMENSNENTFNAPKFSNWQLPGGENYRELLLTLPRQPMSFEEYAKAFEGNPNASKEDLRALYEADRENLKTKNGQEDFKSGHFNEPNVLAHVRFNDRTDAQGKKVLFIEEVQSDWHQKGREKGYAGQNKSLPIEERDGRFYVTATDGRDVADFAYRAQAERFAESQGDVSNPPVPDAPFKKTWHELAMKRMLRYAVENGYDKIAWTTGDQQAERYDLSKQISEIRATTYPSVALEPNSPKRIILKIVTEKEPNLNVHAEESDLADHVGKDLAKQILAQPPDMSISGTGKPVVYSGLDLRVGGEGMKGFYDQIIPSFLNKYAKKWGGRVADIEIPQYEQKPFSPRGKEISVHSLDITPSMKESLTEKGQPFYGQRGHALFLTEASGRIADIAKSAKDYQDFRRKVAEDTDLQDTARLYSLNLRQTYEDSKKESVPPGGTPKPGAQVKPGKPMIKMPGLTLEVDIQRTADKLDAMLNQAENVAKTGTIQPKDARPGLGYGLPKETNVTNVKVAETIKKLFVDSVVELERLKNEAERTADDLTITQLEAAQKRYEIASSAFLEQRSIWGRVGHVYQRGVQEDLVQAAIRDGRDASAYLKSIKNIKPKLKVLDRVVLATMRMINPEAAQKFAQGEKMAGFRMENAPGSIPENLRVPRAVFDAFRINLFQWGSPMRDSFDNAVAVGTETAGYLGQDLYSISKGENPRRITSIIKALKQQVPSAIGRPLGFKDRVVLPDAIEKALGNDIRDVSGKDSGIMTDIKFGKVPLDAPLSPVVKLKRAADILPSRIFAMGDLMNSAARTADAKALSGLARQTFIDDFLRNPPEAASKSAIEIGKKIKFQVDLTKTEKVVSNNWMYQLLGDAFPSWAFQYSRWAGRTLGADPEMWKKIKAGEAGGAEITGYLTKAATGWGGIYLVNTLLYPHIDFNSMEYVDDDGRRTRLSGTSAIPMALFAAALFKGDMYKAAMALKYAPIPGAKLIPGSQAGLLSNWLESVSTYFKGGITDERFQSEVSKIVNNLVPGRAVLSLLKTIADPVLRQGIGAEIPFYSKLKDPVINPSTGKPMEPRQEGFGIELPAAGGTAIPGFRRVQTPLEREMQLHGIGLFRDRRTPIAEFPTDEIPSSLRQEFKSIAGEFLNRIGTNMIQNQDYQKLSRDRTREGFDAQTKVLEKIFQAAQDYAVATIEAQRGVKIKQKVTPFKTMGLPEKYAGKRKRVETLGVGTRSDLNKDSE